MTGRIPKHFIDELLARTDIVGVIEARVPLKRAGSNYTACCPFHNEKTPSFTVTPSKQFYHCFGCGAHGTAIGFLMEYDRLNFPEAVEALAHSAGMEVPKEAVQQSAQTEEFKPLYELLNGVSDYYRQQLKKGQVAIDYLKNRGLSGETAKNFGIGYAPPGWDNVLQQFGKDDSQKLKLARTGLLIEKDSGGHYDRFRNRIMFPIRNRRGNIIGFGGRSIDPNDTPKYLNSPETPLFHKGRELYGLYEAQQQRPRPSVILVVEGYMDVVMLAEHGVHNAVATLGTATSRDHIQTLFKAVPEIVFCFDGDNAGRQAAWRALEIALPELDDRHQIKFLFLPQDEDPDSYVRKHGREKFESLLKSEAVSLSTYLFDNLKQRFDTRALDGRARLAEEAKGLIATTQDNLFRQLLLNELSELTKLSLQQLGYGKSEPSQRQTQQRSPNHLQVEMNNMRKAIAALLTKPNMALNLEPPQILRTLSNPGIELLFELITLCRSEPEVTAGRLVQRYQEDNSAYASILSRLAAYQFADSSDEGIKQELYGALTQLEKEAREQRHKELLEKPRNQLTSSELQELQSFRRI
ncbi:MAG TPA: DNA primase [Gammaproteobacteria bacterium]